MLLQEPRQQVPSGEGADDREDDEPVATDDPLKSNRPRSTPANPPQRAGQGRLSERDDQVRAGILYRADEAEAAAEEQEEEDNLKK